MRELYQFIRLPALFYFQICHSMSPHQYLRLLRMERARYLFETSFISVKEITRKAGVPDESHFSRDFEKANGASPIRYQDACAAPELNEPLPFVSQQVSLTISKKRYS